jgi:hypothetical protein
MDEEVIKIEIINSEGAKSSAPSIDPIPFSKIETCPLFILWREVLDNMENLATLFDKIEVNDNFKRESFK